MERRSKRRLSIFGALGTKGSGKVGPTWSCTLYTLATRRRQICMLNVRKIRTLLKTCWMHPDIMVVVHSAFVNSYLFEIFRKLHSNVLEMFYRS